jgi:hypothetical protein
VSNARIIWVTGMKPKPEPVEHRSALKRVLAAALARMRPGSERWLDERPENFILCSWTSLLYSEQRDIALDKPGIERLLANPIANAEERREIDRFGRKLKRIWHLLGDSFPALSAMIASSALKVTLADVHRYLDDRGGVAGRIRSRLVAELEAAWADGDRVLLMGHSLGSVIAYDSLWQLAREKRVRGRVELFMTLGSPIATRFIRQRLLGGDRRGAERFPDNIDRWLNVSARGEMVALNRRIKPFFAPMLAHGLIDSIRDEPAIYNHFHGINGLDVHKSYGYLNHAVVAGHVARWLRD